MSSFKDFLDGVKTEYEHIMKIMAGQKITLGKYDGKIDGKAINFPVWIKETLNSYETSPYVTHKQNGKVIQISDRMHILVNDLDYFPPIYELKCNDQNAMFTLTFHEYLRGKQYTTDFAL